MNAILEQINSAGLKFVEFALPMFVQSVVLIVILLLADFALRKKVRAVFRYWIWLLVLVKLILPTSLSSPMSLGYFFGDRLTYVDKVETPPQPQANAVEASPASVPPFIDLADIEADRFTPAAPPMITEAVPTVTSPADTLTISATPLSWQGAVFLAWLTVVIAMVLLLLQRAIFVRGLVAQAKEANGFMADTLESCHGSISVKRKLGLKISTNATSPAVCGLFNPVILVPQNLASSLTASQLRAVLLHELAHIRRGDLFLNLAQTILQIVYFYNPLVWFANCIIRRIREQAVDEMVLAAMGEKAPQYPQTLVSVAKLAFKRPVLSLRLIGVVESKNALASRIKHILNRPMPKKAKLGILGLLVVIIIGAILLPMASSMPGPPKLVIKGIVKDAQTGEPIAGARVFDDGYGPEPIWEQIRPDVRSQWGAITNSAGQYSFLTWPEHHSIKVQSPGFKPQRRSLYSGHFTFNKKDQEIFDFTLEPEKVSNSSEFKTTLPNGVTVELVGICEDPTIKGQQWWSPNGKEMKEPEYELRGKQSFKYPAFGYLLKFSPFEELHYRSQINLEHLFFSSGPVTSKGQAIVFWGEGDQQTEPLPTQDDITVDVAAGEWTENKPGRYSVYPEFTNLADKKVIFLSGLRPNPKEGMVVKTLIEATTTSIDMDIQLECITTDGKSHKSWNEGSLIQENQLIQHTFGFAVPMEDIDKIHVKHRKFHQVKFKNVSLKPNFKTDVQVEAEATDKNKVNVPKISKFSAKVNDPKYVSRFYVKKSASDKLKDAFEDDKLSFDEMVGFIFKSYNDGSVHSIDFDTNRIIQAPDDLDIQNKQAVRLWTESEGVDAIIHPNRLTTTNMAIVWVNEKQWGNISSNMLKKVKDSILNSREDLISVSNEYSYYVFKSSDGRIGVVGLFFNDTGTIPRRLLIKYKMLKSDMQIEPEIDWVVEDYGQTRLLSDKEKPDIDNWVSIWASAVKNKGRYLVPDRGLTLKGLIKAAGYNRDKLAESYIELSRRSRQGNITACSSYSRNLKTLLSGEESDIVLKSHDSILGGYIEPSANGVEFWSGYSFGDVVEMTVNDDGAKINMFADFDAGELIIPPDTLDFDDENAVLRWIKDNGIDVMGETASSVHGLIGFNMYATRVDNYFWDVGPPEFTNRLMERIDEPVLLSVEDLLPLTYLIKTSEYKMGILQILAFVENPKGIKIRYKLLNKEAAPKSDVRTTPEPVSGDWQYIGRAIVPDFNDTMILTEHVNLGSIGRDAEGKTFITLFRDREKTKGRQYRFVLFNKAGNILEPDGHLVLGEGKRLEEKFTFDEPFMTRRLKGFRFQSRSLPTSGFDNISSILQEVASEEIKDENILPSKLAPPGRYAVELDGVDDYLLVPDSPTLRLEPPFTIEMWIKTKLPPDATEYRGGWALISKGFTVGTPRAYLTGFGINLDRRPKEPSKLHINFCKANNSGTYGAMYGGYPLKNGVSDWMHITHVFKDEYYKSTPGHPLVMGKYLIPTNNPFKGLLGEVRLWNGARTRQELRQYKDVALTGTEPGLAACWTFEQTKGRYAYDISGNNNHARLGKFTAPDEADPKWIDLQAPSPQFDLKTDVQVEEIEPESEYVFGPVINCLVNTVDAEKDSFIDLDTGKAFSSEKIGTKDREELFRAKGIDISILNLNSAMKWIDGDVLLGCYDMIAVGLKKKEWETITLIEVTRKIETGQRVPNRGLPVKSIAGAFSPSVYAIKTREGSMGIIQILGFNDNPKCIKIRYKMVKKAPGRKTDLHAEKVEPESEYMFGAVIDCVVYAIDAKADSFIDFDTGEYFSTPKKKLLMFDFDVWNRSHVVPWAKKTGADATLYYKGDPKNISWRLSCYDMAAMKVQPDYWQSLRAEQIVRHLSKATHFVEDDIGMSVYPPNATHIFKTREGSMGIAQIIDYTDNPKCLKIRYKMVKKTTGPKTDMQVMTDDGMDETVAKEMIEHIIDVNLPESARNCKYHSVSLGLDVVFCYGYFEIHRMDLLSLMDTSEKLPDASELGQNPFAIRQVEKALELYSENMEWWKPLSLDNRQYANKVIFSSPSAWGGYVGLAICTGEIRDDFMSVYLVYQAD